MHRLLHKPELLRSLDRVTSPVASAMRKVLDGTGVDKLLRGSWLGHPVHPLLITMPIGSWVCSTVLDLFGRQEAARNLVTFGLVMAVPTVVTGSVELSTMPPVTRRVGLVHAATNTVAAACYLMSRRYRTAGAYRPGVAWSILGLAAVTAGGALGGHLTYALGAGVHEWQNGPQSAR